MLVPYHKIMSSYREIALNFSNKVTHMRFCVQCYGEGNQVTAWDLENKKATLKDGRVIQYEAAISTMPLDLTLNMAGKVSIFALCTRKGGGVVCFAFRILAT